MRPKSLFFPLLLISIGAVLFLTNIGIIQGTTWGILARYWPVVLIIGGLDGLYRRDGWIGPLVLIGFGTVLQLGNLGYFSQNAWQLLLRLWPVFLVGIGLDLAFGRSHSIWSVLGRVLVGFLLIGGIFWFAVAAPFGTANHPVAIHQALDGATSSALQFSMAAGEFDLKAGATENSLLSGNVSLPNSNQYTPNYTAPKNGKSSYVLQGPGVVFGTSSREQALWDLAVNSKIPLEIQVNLGAGEMKIDLSGTQTQTIKADLGVGQTEVDLPSGKSISGTINTAVGEIILRIPSCAAVKISLDRGLTDTNLPAGYANQNGDIVYQAPSGCSGNQVNLNVSLAMGSLQIIKLP